MADKTVGRGKGKFAVAGHEANQEDRLTALEDIVADNVENGNLVVDEPEEEEAPPA